MAHTPPPTNPSHHDIVWLYARLASFSRFILTIDRNSAGPRLVGLIFNWGLLGVLTTQLYVYYLNFPQDRRVIKLLGMSPS